MRSSMIPGLVSCSRCRQDSHSATRVAFDLADKEPLADQFVEPYTADRQLPSCSARWQPHLVDDFLLNEGERTSRRGAIWIEVPIALQAFARDGLDRLDHPQPRVLRRP